ncbi:hypothetical protein BDB01DRAFT_832697 [Pilobolus umbonatus]|nr:hypothetical protein BDB01DRAFT_832697 [Pilobolus umbonatus]
MGEYAVVEQTSEDEVYERKSLQCPIEERGVFDRLLYIKHKLMALKKQGNMTSETVCPIEQEVEDTLSELTAIRHGILYNEGHENNRVDDELNKGNHMRVRMPFTYVMQYTHSSPSYLHLLQGDCNEERIYDHLSDTLESISDKHQLTLDALLRTRSDLFSILLNAEIKEEDVVTIEHQLTAIGKKNEEGQLILNNIMVERESPIYKLYESIKSVCRDLKNLKNLPRVEYYRGRLCVIETELKELEITSKWSLRETDLFTYGLQLHDVAQMLHEADRNKSSFKGGTGKTLLTYLLLSCYDTIVNLLEERPVISAQLFTLYNQLTTLEKCLDKLKSLRCDISFDELMLYTLKLNSIKEYLDIYTKEDHPSLPEGRCYQLVEDLRSV